MSGSERAQALARALHREQYEEIHRQVEAALRGLFSGSTAIAGGGGTVPQSIGGTGATSLAAGQMPGGACYPAGPLGQIIDDLCLRIAALEGATTLPTLVVDNAANRVVDNAGNRVITRGP